MFPFYRIVGSLLISFLIAGCGGGGGDVANAAPLANAGANQNVVAGTLVTLNGSASSDADGDPLTYAWTLTSRPPSSAAALAGATSAAPTFTADAAGTYVASLVVNDGKANSAPATVTVTVTVANVAPVANAGANQNVVAVSLVTLNGSASSDADGDPLTYAWTLTSKPASSAAALAGATSAAPTFTADAAGTYVATLVVNDGKVNSTPATVTITATVGNAAPVANAGVNRNVLIGTVVTLDGGASYDVNLDKLTYTWTLTSRPTGSAAVLGGANTVDPTFTADIAGTYVATLVVNDGKVNSAPATVMVTANPVRYTATKIALPAGVVGYAEGLNNRGQVVGGGYYYGSNPTVWYGFVTGDNAGNVQSLAAFLPTRINANGLAIGGGTSGGGTLDITTGQITILPTLGGTATNPMGVNDAGWIVGGSYPANSFVNNAFALAPNTVSPILIGPQSGGDITAVDINSFGIAVGNPSPYSNSQAFVVDVNTGVWMGIGPTGARAVAINDLGQVLFEHFITDVSRLVLTPLGTLGGNTTGLDLNSQGVVVGASEVAPSVSHAFVTGKNGVGISDLNTITPLPAGVTLYRAVGINEQGQIAVQANDGNYLLTPAP